MCVGGGGGCGDVVWVWIEREEKRRDETKAFEGGRGGRKKENGWFSSSPVIQNSTGVHNLISEH